MKTKTNINDLNEYLFEALDRITNDDLDPETLDRELRHADAIVSVAETVIHNGELMLKAMNHAAEYNVPMPKLLGGGGE